MDFTIKTGSYDRSKDQPPQITRQPVSKESLTYLASQDLVLGKYWNDPKYNIKSLVTQTGRSTFIYLKDVNDEKILGASTL